MLNRNLFPKQAQREIHTGLIYVCDRVLRNFQGFLFPQISPELGILQYSIITFDKMP